MTPCPQTATSTSSSRASSSCSPQQRLSPLATTGQTRAATQGNWPDEAEHRVSAVACPGRADDRDAVAFRESELHVHELGLDEGLAGLLGAMDQLLAVSRAAPGAGGVYGMARGRGTQRC